MTWRDSAACAESDPEIWFPKSSAWSPGHPAWTVPRFICQGCPVLAECRAWVDENPQPEGMFGGLTPAERDNPGRFLTCRRGHSLTEPGSVHYTSTGRRCVACARARAARVASKAKRRAAAGAVAS